MARLLAAVMAVSLASCLLAKATAQAQSQLWSFAVYDGGIGAVKAREWWSCRRRTASTR